MNILFISTENTRRGPMAKALAKEHFKSIDKIHTIKARGLKNVVTESSSNNSAEALKEIGLYLGKEKSRVVTRDEVINANIILTMTIAERDLLKIAYYDVENIDSKVQTLSCYGRGIDKDIVDPYFSDLNTYKEVRDEIKSLIESINWR